jgi:hypothetical protein
MIQQQLADLGDEYVRGVGDRARETAATEEETLRRMVSHAVGELRDGGSRRSFLGRLADHVVEGQ